MAEPTTTTTAAAWAVAAGLVSAFLAAIGVSWPVLFFALCGGLIGAGWAPKAGRARAIAIFPASAMLSAKWGILCSAWIGAIGALSGESLAQALAGAVCMFFHPLAAAAVGLIPALAATRLGVQPPPENRQ